MARNKLLSPSTSPVAMAPKMNAKAMEDERRYRAEDALRTITKADQMRRDASLMKDVKQLATATMKAVCAPRGKK